MLYRSLRAAAGVALRWFYREVAVEGLERVPADAPLLVAANHPNQLIDALLVGLSLGREVTFTGKAILMDSAPSRFLLQRLPFVPLRRAADERQAAKEGRRAAPADRARNADAFQAILDALADQQAVLIFPEGISHDRPELAPIRTGAARIALQARDERGLADLHIVPVGLTFERKWAPRTRALVQVGEPIRIGSWRAPDGAGEVDALTAELDRRLRAVTLNFPTADAAAEALGVAGALGGATAAADDVRSLGSPDAPLAELAALARRAGEARAALDAAPAELAARAARLRTDVDAFADEMRSSGIEAGDLGVATDRAAALRFTLRELWLGVAGGPAALWGRVNHWPALTLARLVARRTSRTPEDPAMHTVVAGLAAVPLCYALQTAAVGAWVGWWWAALYLLSLPAAGTWSLRFADRWARARQRAHAFVTFRRSPDTQRRLVAELVRMRGEAAALESAVGGQRAALVGR